MKTILAATDFSDYAYNAIEYAANLAAETNAKLILFHVYYIPVLGADGIPMVPPLKSLEEMRDEALSDLNEIKYEIQTKIKKPLTIECICREGIVVDQVNKVTEEKNIDLVVMGIKGRNALMEIMLGSNTRTFIEQGNCALLAINENISFKKIKRIVLACGDNLISQESARPLKEIADLFNARTYVLNVFNEPAKVLSDNKAAVCISLEQTLENNKHSVHFIENEDIIDGINVFAEEKKADMIAMMPGKHKLLQRIFHKSNTKKMLFHTHLPVLVLPNLS